MVSDGDDAAEYLHMLEEQVEVGYFDYYLVLFLASVGSDVG